MTGIQKRNSGDMAITAYGRAIYGGWLGGWFVRIRGLLRRDHTSELRDLDERSLNELRRDPLDRPFRME